MLSSRIAQAVQAGKPDKPVQAPSVPTAPTAPSPDPEILPRQTGGLIGSAPLSPWMPSAAQEGPAATGNSGGPGFLPISPAASTPNTPSAPASASGATGPLARYGNSNTGPLSPSRLPANGSATPDTSPELNTTFLGSTGSTGPLLHTGPLRTGPFDRSVLARGETTLAAGSALGAVRQVPRGALELLPQEEVAFQLGALYLTTKRVILLAPSVIRSAFIRDIDAVGTYTERASGWYLFSGILCLALGAGSVYLSLNKDNTVLHDLFSVLYDANSIFPILLALALLVLAVALLARYFMHVKRTLFVSVKGRPLITVSIADWNTRKLDGMDAFVNAFFQIKDYLTGEIGDRQF